jgi:molybdopterin-guanine dinucleotide biosynthesis adapter protein
MKVFSIIGFSKSGKTTTIEFLIKELRKRGFSTGSIKEIHHKDFSIDTGGTDTDRHRKAGADIVAARACSETDLLFGRKLSIDEILRFYDHDFVLLEGVKDFNCPIILCVNSIEEIKDYENKDFSARIFAVSGKAANDACKGPITIKNGSINKKLPLINSIKEIGTLADLVIEKVNEKMPDFPPERL